MRLKTLFEPNSIAIIGVSDNPKKVGYLVVKNLKNQGYNKRLFLINPKLKDFLGQEVYPSISSIKDKIDLAVFATPSSVTLSLLDELSEAGCKNVIIFASGFKETHDETGAENEKLLLKKARKYRMNILGPNCIGLINTRKKVNLTFMKGTAPSGNIGIISQSGALGSAMIDQILTQSNTGISHFISLGNKSILDESEMLEYLARDKGTEVVGIYLEDVKNGQKFLKILKATTSKKPVVILKSGSTKEGSQAAISHTGSMVGDDSIFERAITQAGAVRADSFSEFETILKIYSFKAVPRNENILVLSNAGGMGVLLADDLIKNNLKLITVSEKIVSKLVHAFDGIKKITAHNPIDLLGDASAFDYRQAVSLTAKEKNIGATIVLLTPQANTQIISTAKVLISEKISPLYPVFMGGASVKSAHEFFESNNVVSFRYYTALPKILSKILVSKSILSNKRAKPPRDLIMVEASSKLRLKSIFLENRSRDILNQLDSLKILSLSGIRTVETFLAVNEDDLSSIVKKEGYPLVAKIASSIITHKTEVKGVVTGINSWAELVSAYHSLTSLEPRGSGCYVQKQLVGHELIIGAKRDETFGVVVIVGLGGVYAELIREIVQFVYPIEFGYFKSALMASKIHKLATGYRNLPKVDVGKLFQIVENLAKLMVEYPQILELDINPLIVTDQEMTAVDARVVLK